MDDPGFDKIPARYDTDNGEAIDLIREELSKERIINFESATFRIKLLRLIIASLVGMLIGLAIWPPFTLTMFGMLLGFSISKELFIKFIEQLTKRESSFIAYCKGSAMKYNLRLGKKNDPSNELEKYAWYQQMALHIEYPDKFSDPREYRKDG